MNTDPVQVSSIHSPATTLLAGTSGYKPGGVPPPPIMHPHHMNAYAMQSMSEGNIWAGLMFGVILAGLLKLWARQWWQGSLILLFATSFLMAVYYVKRPRITHSFARILCALFFVTFRDVTNQRPPRRFLRLSVAFAISLLSVLLFVWPKSRTSSKTMASTTPPAQSEAVRPQP